jgi:hypothetical protein
LDEWRRRNNLLIFGITGRRQESNFDTLKITEDILRMKLKVDIFSWHIESVRRMGKKRGRTAIMVRFISLRKKS